MKRLFISRNRTFSIFQAFIALIIAQNELKRVISFTRMRWEFRRNSRIKRMCISRKRTFSWFQAIIARINAHNKLKNVISSTRMR